MSRLWGADSRVVRKAIERISRYEKRSRFLEKRSEEYEVLEEVFDKPTLFTLFDLMNSGAFRYLNGVLSAGKESRIYWGVRDDDIHVAVKIYLVIASEFKKRLPYIEGDPRFKDVKRGSESIVELWARKEFRNLHAALTGGVRVPKPYAVKRNVLVMEFIGSNGQSSPLLHDVGVAEKEYVRTIMMVKRLFTKAKLVHADLSEFNIIKHRHSLVFFDFGSAVDIRHPMALEFLGRDISNINRFFTKRGIKITPLEEVLGEIVR